MRVPPRFDRYDRNQHVRIDAPSLGIDEHAPREVAALPARHLRIDMAEHRRVDGDCGRRRRNDTMVSSCGGNGKKQQPTCESGSSQEAGDGPTHMGPVGSRLTSEPPSAGGSVERRRYRNRALAIVFILFGVMCGMIAWSQWYAIHVNVPMYRAQHASTASH